MHRGCRVHTSDGILMEPRYRHLFSISILKHAGGKICDWDASLDE